MMTPREVMTHVAAEPFRPFRIHMSNGRTFQVQYPEVVQVGRTTLALSVPLSDIPDAEGLWYQLPLTLVESIEPLEAPVRQKSD